MKLGAIKTIVMYLVAFYEQFGVCQNSVKTVKAFDRNDCNFKPGTWQVSNFNPNVFL
jgi:hypothetical protein